MPPSKTKNISDLQFVPITTVQLTTLILVIIALGSLYPPAYLVTMVLISIYSIFSTNNAIKSLALVYLIRAINPAFSEADLNLAFPGIFSVLICCSRIYYDYSKYRIDTPAPLRHLTLYVITTGFLSLYSSQFISVSLFKLTYFYIVAAAILISYSTLSKTQSDITSWIASFYAAVTILSFPLIFHNYGYFRDGVGFQGLLNHPQEFAIFMAPYVAILAVKAFRSRGKNLLFSALWLSLVLSMLLLSRARTGILAIILGLILGYFAYSNKKPLLKTASRVIPLFSVLVIIATVAIYLIPVNTTQFLSTFVFKGTDGDISEAYEASRGFLVLESFNNIISHPIAGIGFGVNLSELRPSEPIYEPLTGLPISFPTEKPNLIIAVLEESGIIGLAFFLIFIFSLLKYARPNGELIILVLGFTALLTNIGEMTFFSMNSYGLFMWLLLGSTTYKYDKH